MQKYSRDYAGEVYRLALEYGYILNDGGGLLT